MSEENKIWSGLQADTYTSRFHFVLLDRDYEDIYIDESTCKLIARDGDNIGSYKITFPYFCISRQSA